MTDNDHNVKSDYEYSRETYYDLLEKGRESLEDMIEVARQSEHPRAYSCINSFVHSCITPSRFTFGLPR